MFQRSSHTLEFVCNILSEREKKLWEVLKAILFLSTSFVHDRLHQFDYQYTCELSGWKMVKIIFERVEYKQKDHGQHAHLRNQFKSIELWLYHNVELERRKPIISFFKFLMIEWSIFIKPWVPFPQGCFVPNLVKIGPVVLEIFKSNLFL